MTLRFHEVETAQELQTAYAQIATSPSIALDTEFMRERTYFPKLSLIQVATPDTIWLLDPLMDHFDWIGLKTILINPSITKIIHAPQQDFEALSLHDVIPCGLCWDTQTASMLCGNTQTLGYEALVQEHLGITLDKGEQRSAWDRRPLTSAQKSYAAQDVAHLHALIPLLEHNLQECGRLTWFREDMAFLSARPLYNMHKVFGLKPEWVEANPTLFCFYTIVQRLFAWRENQAQMRNIPREFLWDNHTLMTLAEWASAQEDRSIPPPFMPRNICTAWSDLHRLFDDVSPILMPYRTSITRPASHHTQELLLKRLRHYANQQAESLQMPVALIATRDELKRFAYGENDVRFLTGWRYPLFGQQAERWRNDHAQH